MQKKALQDKLSGYLPQASLSVCADWIIAHRISLTISPERSSKRGDYRSPRPPQGHRISVNGTLNPYSFLITFTHEVAHLRVWEKHKRKVKPHGPEWKEIFKELMCSFQGKGIFPADIELALAAYMRDPLASTTRDQQLMRCLSQYNTSKSTFEQKPQNQLLYLEDLPDNSLFRLAKQDPKRVFKKLKKLRKHYLCISESDQVKYRVHALAEVIKVEK